VWFEADRDEVGKLNVRKRALKILGLNWGSSDPPTATPQMDRCKPESTGEPPSPKGDPRPFKAGRRSA